MRHFVCTMLVLVFAASLLVQDGQAQKSDPLLTVFKTATCTCCGSWVEHVEEAGFRTDVIVTDRMGSIKKRYKVPEDLRSCHTTVVGGYVVEGHVPAATIRRLLEEKPDIVGIGVAGMPYGSPGMSYPDREPQPYDVMTFDAYGRQSVYEHHGVD